MHWFLYPALKMKPSERLTEHEKKSEENSQVAAFFAIAVISTASFL